MFCDILYPSCTYISGTVEVLLIIQTHNHQFVIDLKYLYYYLSAVFTWPSCSGGHELFPHVMNKPCEVIAVHGLINQGLTLT